MNKKNVWVLLLCMLCGLTLGYFLGALCDKVDVLRGLNYQSCFGLDSPVQINLGVIELALQVKFKITIFSILGLLLGVFTYKKL